MDYHTHCDLFVSVARRGWLDAENCGPFYLRASLISKPLHDSREHRKAKKVIRSIC